MSDNETLVAIVGIIVGATVVLQIVWALCDTVADRAPCDCDGGDDEPGATG